MDNITGVPKPYAFLFQEVSPSQQPTKTTADYDDHTHFEHNTIGHSIMTSSMVIAIMDVLEEYYLYLWPALWLNPCFILHVLNTILTTTLPNFHIPYMTKMHAQPFLDINDNNTVAMIYTALVIVLQACAYYYCIESASQRELLKGGDAHRTQDSYFSGDDI